MKKEMAQEEPDIALVQALKLGEDQALNALMDRHREGLFRFVFGISLKAVEMKVDRARKLLLEKMSKMGF